MIFKRNNNIVEVYFPFNGDEYLVGNITMIDFLEDDVFDFTDTLFGFNVCCLGDDLDIIKDYIIEYYGNRDTIGRIEDKYY